MLTEERYSKILECLNEYKTVTVTQLAEALNASESTIRRDLNSLATMKKIIKVHGGATVLNDSFNFSEHPVESKGKNVFRGKKRLLQNMRLPLLERTILFYRRGNHHR